MVNWNVIQQGFADVVEVVEVRLGQSSINLAGVADSSRFLIEHMVLSGFGMIEVERSEVELISIPNNAVETILVQISIVKPPVEGCKPQSMNISGEGYYVQGKGSRPLITATVAEKAEGHCEEMDK